MVETVKPFKLHPMSISYIIYKVLEHLQPLHSHHYSTTEVSPDLGKMAETIGDVTVSVQIMPLRYG